MALNRQSLHSSLAARNTQVTWAVEHTSPCLLPFASVAHYNMDYYSLTDPGGVEGWVGHISWLMTGGLTTKRSPVQASSLEQDMESSPVETSGPATNYAAPQARYNNPCNRRSTLLTCMRRPVAKRHSSLSQIQSVPVASPVQVHMHNIKTVKLNKLGSMTQSNEFTDTREALSIKHMKSDRPV